MWFLMSSNILGQVKCLLRRVLVTLTSPWPNPSWAATKTSRLSCLGTINALDTVFMVVVMHMRSPSMKICFWLEQASSHRGARLSSFNCNSLNCSLDKPLNESEGKETGTSDFWKPMLSQELCSVARTSEVGEEC